MSRVRERLRDAEAVAALAVAAAALRLLPFRTVARLAGRVEAGVPPANATPEPAAAAVGRSIERAGRRVPWKATCLVRALAGRLMLARRRLPSVLCLGVAKEDGELKAHAWLVAAGGTVCGGREAAGFTPIGSFVAGRPR